MDLPPFPDHAEVVARARRRVPRLARRALALDDYRVAAVAVMLLDAGGVTQVILTRRAPALRAHSGQISLPGGRRDPCDDSLVVTAKRESQEEIGVDPGGMHVIGALDDEPTSSRYIITPIVAELNSRPHYVPNPEEVAEILEVPLAVFSDRRRSEDQGVHTIDGITYHRRVFHHGPHTIHGATARILLQLAELVRSSG